MKRTLLTALTITALGTLTSCSGREEESDVPAVDQPATPAPAPVQPPATLDTVTRDTLTTTTTGH